jgi:hypothetical protein
MTQKAPNEPVGESIAGDDGRASAGIITGAEIRLLRERARTVFARHLIWRRLARG